MRSIRFAIALPVALALTGCPKNNDALTRQEAQSALEEAQSSSSAESLESANIELSTSFTLGDGVTNAATSIGAAITSQLPCADVTVSDATLTVEYGVNSGNCTYRGHTFMGSSSISVEKNENNEVLVHHEWTDLSNGVVTLNGHADVTWSFTDETRRVVHHAEWTHLATGRTGVGDGDRTQSPLDGDLTVGIQVDGSHSWTGKDGKWDVGIDHVQWRWQDPIPQAGSYTLATPFDKSVTLSFSRVDTNTIGVTVAGTKGSFSFKVTTLGK